MHPGENQTERNLPDPLAIRVWKGLIALLATAVVIVGVLVVLPGGPDDTVRAADLAAANQPESPAEPPVVPTIASTTTVPSTTTTLLSSPPPFGERFNIPPTEAAPEVKQLAVDIAYTLTTYEATEDHLGRLEALGSRYGVEVLAETSAPLIYDGNWSRGEVIYPQLGGLNDERASVMVVTRQTVGSGSEAEFTLVRTLDIRLVLGESGWEFDFLSDAGGVFDPAVDLTLVHAVANDPRITMPDSARLDILSGLVSSKLLEVMAELAEQTPYEVVTLATGHPHHVFDTDRVSRHTVGQAVDINRIGDRLVIDDRDPDSATHSIVEWLYDHPDVQQVGSPWDIDGSGSSRSFTDAVHQDHIHLAVDG